MKTLKEIIKQEPIFLNRFSDKNDVISNFEEENLNVNILFASYGGGCWEGSAWVLFEQNGELYEVNGSHCSCYGLEGQWSPEIVTLKVLEHRLLNGDFGCDWSENYFRKELCEFLGI